MGGGGASLTSFSEHVSTFTLFLYITIFLGVGLEALRHQLEKCLTKRPRIRAVLNHVYKELSTIGLVSFLLFLCEASGLVEMVATAVKSEEDDNFKGSHFYALVFEWVHMLLFISLLIYMVIVAVLMLFSSSLVKSWKKWDGGNVTSQIKEFSLLLTEKDTKSWFHFEFWRRFQNARDALSYSLTRKQFLEQFGGKDALPTTFDFMSYLCLSLDECCVEVVKLHWSIWVLALVLLGFNWIRYKFFFVESESMAWFILALGTCVSIFSVVFLNKSLRIRRKFLVDECSFDAPTWLTDLDLASPKNAKKSEENKKFANAARNVVFSFVKTQAVRVAPKRSSIVALTEGNTLNVPAIPIPPASPSRAEEQRHEMQMTDLKATKKPKKVDSVSISVNEEEDNLYKPTADNPMPISAAWCCGTCRRRQIYSTEVEKQFWFASPKFHLRCFQLILLFQSIYATCVLYYLLILHGTNFYIFLALGWMPFMFSITFTIPQIIANHALTTSVGTLARINIMKEIMQKAVVKHHKTKELAVSGELTKRLGSQTPRTNKNQTPSPVDGDKNRIFTFSPQAKHQREEEGKRKIVSLFAKGHMNKPKPKTSNDEEKKTNDDAASVKHPHKDKNNDNEHNHERKQRSDNKAENKDDYSRTVSLFAKNRKKNSVVLSTTHTDTQTKTDILIDVKDDEDREDVRAIKKVSVSHPLGVDDKDEDRIHESKPKKHEKEQRKVYMPQEGHAITFDEEEEEQKDEENDDVNVDREEVEPASDHENEPRDEHLDTRKGSAEEEAEELARELDAAERRAAAVAEKQHGRAGVFMPR